MWSDALLAKAPELKEKTLFEVLYANGQANKYSLDEIPADRLNDESRDFGFYVQKSLFEEYATFGRGKAHDLGTLRSLSSDQRFALASSGWKKKPSGVIGKATTPYVKSRRGSQLLR